MVVKRSLLALFVGIFAAAGIMVLAQPAYALTGKVRCICKGNWTGTVIWTVDGASDAEVAINCVNQRNASATLDLNDPPADQDNVTPNDINFHFTETDKGATCTWNVPDDNDVRKAKVNCEFGQRATKIRLLCRTNVR